MGASISFNPVQTTNAAGSFSVQSDGFVQGIAMDDPAIRNELAGGVLAAAETLPMWGGVGIYEFIPAAGNNGVLGRTVGRATSIASTYALAGFSVFNQAHGMISTPQSPVPLAGSGQSINFYRLGSGARIAVACDPGLVSLDGANTNQQVSWDFNNQLLQAYDASTATFALTSFIDSYAANLHTISIVMAVAATNVQGVGDWINLSGVTNTGTGGTAAVNGNFQITQWTDNQHFQIQIAGAAALIQSGNLGGSAVVNSGIGALNVKTLLVLPTGNKTVAYNASTGFATWNANGACALIQI